MGRSSTALRRTTGVGQLSLVEHALCPLDARRSLVENSVYRSEYSYYSPTAGKTTAKAHVFCPLGLSAADELYLWGLLALTLLTPEPEPQLFASPYWCLRQLGIINRETKRGGRQYQQFAEAIKRLSAVSYINDGFYDPLRGEHRRVSFHFFSYSLPTDLDSCRSWRISWDPVFFEFVKAAAGHFRFDLALYRELDTASRRLFLFLSKVFARRTHLKAIRLEHLAVNVLGFSSTLATREMKLKVNRCLAKLIDMAVLSDAEITRTSPGNFFIRLNRGPYYESAERRAHTCDARPEDSPLHDTLLTIGFSDTAAARLQRKYSHRLLAEWADITLAARERFGSEFFRKSPMAYFVDSVSKAAEGNRTAPDWWMELQKVESQTHELSLEGRELFTRLQAELFGAAPAEEQAVAQVPAKGMARAGSLFVTR